MARVRPAEISEELNDIWRLVVGYTKQETAAPMRGLLGFMRWGAVAMVCFALGTLFGMLAILRGMESGLHAWLRAFLPYVGAAVWLILIGAWAVWSVARKPWKTEGDVK